VYERLQKIGGVLLADRVNNRYKECAPQETIKKIQGLLKRMGIKVTEKGMETVCSSCYSVRLCIEGTDIGQNGKGITESFALASAYGEFMERLLTGFLFGSIPCEESSFGMAPDEITRSKEELLSMLEETPTWLSGMCQAVKGSSAHSFIKGAEQDGRYICFPFWKDGVLYEIPAVLVQAYYASNGASAGNSYEECFVQGFSEIVERHHSVELFRRNLTPPQIDKKYLEKMPQIKDVIDKIEAEEGGRYKVEFFDCSMEGEFPVVAAVLIDRSSGNYGIRFGAHPVFEIALERTLTEMFQGRSLGEAACVERVLTKDGFGKDIECIHNLLKAGTGAVHSGFFKKEADFSFNEGLLAGQQEDYTNQALYEKCIRYAKENALDLYVRKLELEGFYVLQILIPGYSEVFAAQGIDRLRQRSFRNAIRPFLKNALAGADADSLRELSVYLWDKIGFAQENTLGFLLGIPLSEEADTIKGFLNQLILTYLRLGNVKAATETIQMMFRYMTDLSDQAFYKCLLQMLQMLNVHEEENVADILSHFYGEELVHGIWHGLEEICSSAPEKSDITKKAEHNILIEKLGFVMDRNEKECQISSLKDNFRRYSRAVVCDSRGCLTIR